MNACVAALYVTPAGSEAGTLTTDNRLPTSTSDALASASSVTAAPSSVAAPVTAPETTGASLVLATVSVNADATVAPARSVATTFNDTAPTSPFSGVPLKVRVAGLNVSHDGNAAPLANVAVYVSVSPSGESASANVLVPTTKLNGESSVAFCAVNAVATVGASFKICAAVNVPLKNWKLSTPLTISIPSGAPERRSEIVNAPPTAWLMA